MDIKNATLTRSVLIEKASFYVRIINFEIPFFKWPYWYVQNEIYRVRSFRSIKDYNSYVRNSVHKHTELYVLATNDSACILKQHCTVVK